MLKLSEIKIAIIGLGYVGLPLVSMAINFDPLLANKIDPLAYR